MTRAELQIIKGVAILLMMFLNLSIGTGMSHQFLAVYYVCRRTAALSAE